MNPITLKYKHDGFLFVIDPYYNPLNSDFESPIESPIIGEPTLPNAPGW